MSLKEYRAKRDFKQTPEPKGKISRANKHRFVCQEHHASSLHFDLRLEIGGVLKSWSVRKGPSMDPAVKRLAVPTEDHPVEYLKFQGDIPEGNYGAGKHRMWDEGTYKLIDGDDAEERFARGKLKFELRGKKLKGVFNLFRLGKQDQWLLVKSKDKHAEKDWKLELLIPDNRGNRFVTENPAGRNNSKAKGAKGEKGVVKKDAGIARGEKLSTLASVLNGERPAGDRRVKIGTCVLSLTSLDRVYFPDDGYTKADLLRYYSSVAKYILPYLKDRPLIMKRYPTGIKGISFHQHDVDEVPEFVPTIELEAQGSKGKHKVDYVVGGNIQTHVYLANLGAIERHPWHSRVEDLQFPDWFVFDMDPGDKVSFGTICDLAVIARDVLAEIGLKSYAKTSGSRGIHVYVPVKAKYTYEQVADLAARVAKRVAEEDPENATVERSRSKRKKNQVYIDHLQNAYGKSIVAPYSVRPRTGATVSAPLEWEEVERKKISISDFTIDTMMKRIEKKGDLFRDVLKKKQSLEGALDLARKL